MKGAFVFALFVAVSNCLLTSAEEFKKPGACVDTLASCAAGQCMAKSDCVKQGKEYSWNEDKCDGDKCGCCEKKAPAPACFKKDDACKDMGGGCVASEAICSFNPGYSFDSTLCTSQPVVNGTGCGCCYPTEPAPTCLKKDDTCKSMGAGAKCVKNMFECNRGASGFVFNSTLCKTGSDDETCGCCYKPKQCKMSGQCGKKKGKCMSAAQCHPLTHQFDDSCGSEEGCVCCFPRA